MKKQWLVALGIFLLVLSTGDPARAANFADDDCATNPFVVDTAAKAAKVANGYNCAGVDLTIKTSLNDNAPSDIVDTNLPITAKSITIEGPNVEIINDLASSTIRLIAVGGDITIKEASIKAKANLRIECQPLLCKIEVDDSELVASFDLTLTPGSGDLLIIAEGDIDIQNTTTWGAGVLFINSKGGSVTWFCPGEGGCKDPNVSSRAVELCDTSGPGGVGPPDGIADFPCTVTFATSKELKDVCFPGVTCGGGAKEIDVFAKNDIDVSGSTIKGNDHMNFRSSQGNFKGAKSTITAPDNIVITVRGTVDISEATITSGNSLNINAGTGCPAAPAVCINGQKSDLEGENVIIRANNALGVIDLCEASVDDTGSDLPTLNGDTKPDVPVVGPGYTPNVKDTEGECGAGKKANIT